MIDFFLFACCCSFSSINTLIMDDHKIIIKKHKRKSLRQLTKMLPIESFSSILKFSSQPIIAIKLKTIHVFFLLLFTNDVNSRCSDNEYSFQL